MSYILLYSLRFTMEHIEPTIMYMDFELYGHVATVLVPLASKGMPGSTNMTAYMSFYIIFSNVAETSNIARAEPRDG